jgi:hypothetical protein
MNNNNNSNSNNNNNNNKSLIDIIDDYRCLGFTWKEIRNFDDVAMTESGIKWWRQKNNYIDPLDHLTNNELDLLISEYVLSNPNRGKIMTWGYLLSEGYRVTREQLRESIKSSNDWRALFSLICELYDL